MPLSTIAENYQNYQAVKDMSDTLFGSDVVGNAGNTIKIAEFLAMAFYGFMAFVTVVGSFAIAIVKYSATAVNRHLTVEKEDIAGLSHLFKIAFFPFLYLFIGVFVYSLLVIIFTYAYDVNLRDYMINFLGFQEQDLVIYKEKHRKLLEFLSVATVWLKAIVLNTSLAIYMSIWIFYIVNIFSSLQLNNVKITVWANLFFAATALMVCVVAANTYDSVASAIYFNNQPTFIDDEIGSVSSLFELFQEKMKQIARLGLGLVSNT